MGVICSRPRGDQVVPKPAAEDPDSSKLLATPLPERKPTRPKLAPLDTRVDHSLIEDFSAPSLDKPVLRSLASLAHAEPLLDLPPHLATVGKGVSLRGLRKVRAAIQQHFGEARYPAVTTTEVCHQWVKEVTAPAGECRLVEVPGLLDRRAGEVGRPMYFISHAWNNSIELLFRTVFDFLASADDGTRVWLDVLAVCQHEGQQAHRHDIAAFPDVVKACSGGTLVVMDLTRCNPSTRAWCVFEWAHTLAAHGPDGLHMRLGPLERAVVFSELDVERAECYRPADKEMIMREVRRQHGSPEAFNAKLKLQLLLQPLSYTVDLRRLQERSKDTVWEFGLVDTWVAEPTSGAGPAAAAAANGGAAQRRRSSNGGDVRGCRALCVVSGAGEGKSTISAELVRRLTTAASAAQRPATAAMLLGTGPDCRANTSGLALAPLPVASPANPAIGSGSSDLPPRPPVPRSPRGSGKGAAATRWSGGSGGKKLSSTGGSGGSGVGERRSNGGGGGGQKRTSAGGGGGQRRSSGGGGGGGDGAAGGGGGVRRRSGTSGGGGVAGAPPPLVFAYHFLKYNDQRRLEPVRIIKTMAFQLASRIPAMCTTLLASDVAEVAQLTDIDRAFELLLMRPLQSCTIPVIIVMDALDEADPAPISLPGADPSISSSPTAAAASPPLHVRARSTAYPVLCGNRALQLLTKHLKRLPASVRFFITTRPDAASGQVVPALERTFHPRGSAYLKPSQLVRAIAVQPAAAAAIAADDNNGGDRAVATATATITVKPTGGASAGVMVYHTVVRDCLGDAKDADEGGGGSGDEKLGSPCDGKSRRGGPLLQFLYGISGATGKTPLSTPTGGSAAADLTALYRVYGKVFRKAHGSYNEKRREEVSQLLNILMAAQEPLSQSLLQQLGLAHAVKLLPGFPVLFYVDEHHLFTLHKSLADWLLLDTSGPEAVSGRSLLSGAASRQDSGHSLAGAGPGGLAGSSASSTRSLFGRLHDRQAKSTTAGNGGGGARTGGGGFFNLRGRGHGQASQATIESEAAAEAAAAAAVAAAAAAPSPSFHIDVSQGHLSLGRCLAATRNSSPSQYCLKYLVTHLAAAGPPAGKLLDEVLSSFGFVEAVFAAGFGANLIRALGSMAYSTRLSGDALRWLRAKQHDIVTAASGAATAPMAAPIAAMTVDASAEVECEAAAVVGTAMMSPIGTELYRVAVTAAGQGWRTRTVVPPYEEWPADQAVLKGHAGGITGVLFSPDGRQLVSCSGGGYELRVWDLSSGTCTAVLLGHTSDVTCLAMSPDGHVLASGSNDMTCRLWDAATGLCTAVLYGHTAGVTGMSFSPPERGKPPRLVSACSDNTLRIWAPAPPHSPGRRSPCKGSGVGDVGGTLLSHLNPHGRHPSTDPTGNHRRNQNNGNGKNQQRISPGGQRQLDRELLGAAATDLLGGPGLAFGAEVVGADLEGSEGCSHECVAVLYGKEGGLQGVAWGPDGKQLAGAHGADLCLWTVSASKVSSTLRGHEGNVLALAFCPSEGGRRLASCGWDKVIKVWDTRTSKCLSTLTGHTELVRAISWTPDGRRLASASSDNTLRIWDITPTLSLMTGNVPSSNAAAVTVVVPCTALLRGSEWMTAVCFGPDGRTLVSGSVAKELRLWELAACEAEYAAAVLAASVAPSAPAGSSRLKLSLAETLVEKITQKSLELFSGDAESADRAAAAAALVGFHALGHTADVTCVTLSPDGVLLATAAEDRTVQVYDSVTLQWLATLEGHSACVTCVAWAPVQRRAPTPPVAGALHQAASSVVLQLASVSHDLTVRIWDLEVSERLKLPGPVSGPGPPPDSTTKAVRATCTAVMEGHTDRVRSVAWSPAGDGQLATGAEDNHVRLWNANMGAGEATMWGHSNYVTCVSYCPADSGRTVTSASQDNTIRIWDTVQRKCLQILQGHDHYVNHIAYTPCGTRLASASCDQTVRVWEHASGTCLKELRGHTHFVNCVAFEPLRAASGTAACGRGGGGGQVLLPLRLASASTDGTVRVWDLRARKCTATLNGHSGPVYCVTWVRGGEGGTGAAAGGSGVGPKSRPSLVSGAADHQVRVWCEGYAFDE